jgi:hypothetical protein
MSCKRWKRNKQMNDDDDNKPGKDNMKPGLKPAKAGKSRRPLPPVETRFKPGQSGNPKGRAVGTRQRLGEAFLTDVLEAWRDHGKGVASLLHRLHRATVVIYFGK